MLRSFQVVALCVLALLCVGVVMVNSASMEIAPPARAAAAASAEGAAGPAVPEPAELDPSSGVVASQTPAARELSVVQIVRSPHAIFMVIALFAMTVAAFLPVRQLAERWAPSDSLLQRENMERDHRSGLMVLALGCGVLLAILGLVYLAGIGKSAKGAERWLRIPMPVIGQLSVQPSEIAKWTLLGVVAWYATKRAAILPLFWAGLVPALIGVGAVAGLIVKEDLGTGALVGAAAALVLIAGGAKLWHLLLLSPLALGAVVAAIATSSYRVKRITAFLDPYADPQETGYHMIQSMGAVSSGGLFGRGLGNGIQKFGYLPEDTNDFIFAIICEELGAPGALMVITLFICLLWASYIIVAREHNRLLKLFALGIVATVGLQALINLAVVTAMGPTKGIALPLVSSGGTGWTLTAFSLGLLIAIGRTQSVAVQTYDEPGLAVRPAPNTPARTDIPPSSRLTPA
ncbi:MAG: FtsW/RodA/SpoVE family cell cycle protein [Tepidisphaera sp.]